MRRRERLAKLEVEITAAAVALEGDDIAALEHASSALLHTIDWDWLISEQPAYVDEAVQRARELRQRLTARIATLEIAELERTLTPCPCCRGVDLIVVKRGKLVVALAEDEPVGYSLVVCKACGDMRMRCDDIGKLAQSDRCLAISLPDATSHPFR